MCFCCDLSRNSEAEGALAAANFNFGVPAASTSAMGTGGRDAAPSGWKPEPRRTFGLELPFPLFFPTKDLI